MMNSHRKVGASIALLALLLAVLGYHWLNRNYGTMGGTGYQYALALYSACNRQDSDRVAELARVIDHAAGEDTLTPAELKWLQQIIAKAQSRRWVEASSDIRLLLEAQVKPVSTVSPGNR